MHTSERVLREEILSLPEARGRQVGHGRAAAEPRLGSPDAGRGGAAAAPSGVAAARTGAGDMRDQLRALDKLSKYSYFSEESAAAPREAAAGRGGAPGDARAPAGARPGESPPALRGAGRAEAAGAWQAERAPAVPGSATAFPQKAAAGLVGGGGGGGGGGGVVSPRSIRSSGEMGGDAGWARAPGTPPGGRGARSGAGAPGAGAGADAGAGRLPQRPSSRDRARLLEDALDAVLPENGSKGGGGVAGGAGGGLMDEEWMRRVNPLHGIDLSDQATWQARPPPLALNP
jgi:hypothetical protein